MRLLSVVTLLSFLALAAAPVFASKPQAKPLTDDEIRDKVMLRLASDRDVKGGGIQVDVKEGVVTLSGKVREDRQKTKAEHLARKVQGVKQVVNQLQVEFASQPGSGAKPSQ